MWIVEITANIRGIIGISEKDVLWTVLPMHGRTTP
jgi:hypothetical protein